MKRIIAIATAILYLLAGAAFAQTTQTEPSQAPETSGAPATSGASAAGPAPTVGKTPLGVATFEMDAVIRGWSARKDLLGKAVLNDAKDKIGTIDDIIVTPDNAVSFAIIGTGGFLGIAKHDVAIPMKQIKLQDGGLLLAGATKEALKALPKFEYAPRK